MDRPALEAELKEMVVETLMLETPAAGDIDSDEPLFGGKLDLDSVNALELGMALSKRYGIEIDSSDEQVREAFASIRTLAEFVGQRLNGRSR